jgi:putative effector of murein hydrolase
MPSRIELRYEVTPTPLLTLLLSNLAKLAGALFAPVVAIVYFTVNENIRPRTKRIILLLLFFLQLSIAVVLAYLAWRVRGQAASDAIADWLIALVTAVASGLPLWLKREQTKGQLPLRP